jgi:hypothetical protein
LEYSVYGITSLYEFHPYQLEESDKEILIIHEPEPRRSGPFEVTSVRGVSTVVTARAAEAFGIMFGVGK